MLGKAVRCQMQSQRQRGNDAGGEMRIREQEKREEDL
jgi:hypothetical protein